MQNNQIIIIMTQTSRQNGSTGRCFTAATQHLQTTEPFPTGELLWQARKKHCLWYFDWWQKKKDVEIGLACVTTTSSSSSCSTSLRLSVEGADVDGIHVYRSSGFVSVHLETRCSKFSWSSWEYLSKYVYNIKHIKEKAKSECSEHTLQYEPWIIWHTVPYTN